MADQLEMAAELGAEEIMEYLRTFIPEDAAEETKKAKFFKILDKYQNEASKIMIELEQRERIVLKQQNLLNARPAPILSPNSGLNYSIETNLILLTNVMKKAYVLIVDFRRFILNESIEYLIQKGKSRTIVYMELEDIVKSMGIRLSSGDNKIYKLVMDTDKTRKTIASLSKDRFLPKEIAQEIQKIENRIRSLKRDAEVLARAKELGKNIHTIEGTNIEYVNINEGYLLETALNIATGVYSPFPESTVEYYEYYLKSRKNNLAGTRGGDFDQEGVQKLQEIVKNQVSQELSWINEKLSLQLKKVAGKFGASVQNASTMSAELFNLVAIITLMRNKSKKVVLNMLQDYFRKGQRAKDFKASLAKDLQMNLETIDEAILNKLKATKGFNVKIYK